MNTAIVEGSIVNHPVVSLERWVVERKKLLARERELTHLRDQIARERRNNRKEFRGRFPPLDQYRARLQSPVAQAREAEERQRFKRGALDLQPGDCCGRIGDAVKGKSDPFLAGGNHFGDAFK